jgi:hypothetical protein
LGIGDQEFGALLSGKKSYNCANIFLAEVSAIKTNGGLLLLNLIPVPTGAPCFINLILFFTGVDEAVLSA